jgi:hypothetical protein
MAMLCVEDVWPMAILCSRNVNCVCSAFLLHVLYLERVDAKLGITQKPVETRWTPVFPPSRGAEGVESRGREEQTNHHTAYIVIGGLSNGSVHGSRAGTRAWKPKSRPDDMRNGSRNMAITHEELRNERMNRTSLLSQFQSRTFTSPPQHLVRHLELPPTQSTRHSSSRLRSRLRP